MEQSVIFIESLNITNAVTFDSVLFLLDFLSEVTTGKPYEVLMSFFTLVERSLRFSDGQTHLSKREEARKFVRYFFFKVAIRNLENLHKYDEIHRKIIESVATQPEI